MKDLRIVKTEKSIKEAFMTLVEEKGFNKVKIIDICERAQINRNTFYLHYYDKEDLLGKMVKDLLQDQTIEIQNLKNEVTGINEEGLKKACYGLINTFYEKIEFYRIILLDSNMSGYVKKSFKELEDGIIRMLNLDYKKKHLAIDYIFNGMVGIITEWIIKDNATVDEIVETICTIGISDLVKFAL